MSKRACYNCIHTFVCKVCPKVREIIGAGFMCLDKGVAKKLQEAIGESCNEYRGEEVFE